MPHRPHPAAQAAAPLRRLGLALAEAAENAGRLASASTCGYALVTGQPCPEHTRPVEVRATLDGVDALAAVVIRPAADDSGRVTVDANAHGISRAAVAYALREAADAFDDAARGDGAEPRGEQQLDDEHQAAEEHPADHEQPRPHPERAPRILTEDEFDKAYRAARAELGLHASRIGTYVVESAVVSALAAVGIMPPPPDPEPGTCPAQFADLTGEWHQCTDDMGHDTARGHEDGEWSWPHGDTVATPQPDDQAQR
ncbi:hypothetical protein AB0M86_45865 [Streptomyces sp. NPDC051639]|uniref:hypothetical protein n=1 Tax=Streptomyces sp. NPDC051639 TaxID=3155671 RepID=UPI00344A433D